MNDCVLVTGGAGFIGSHLVDALLREEPRRKVVVLDWLTYAGSKKNLEDAANSPDLVFVRDRVEYPESVSLLLDGYKPTTVYHLAAETHVDRSIRGPTAFLETNVKGTFMLLEAVREYCKTLGADRDRFRLVNVSTDEVYGSLGANGSFTEESPIAPNSPYSASKASADCMARAFHSTYGLPVITTRCSNNYGPRQHPEKLIPLVIARALERKPIPLYGDGQQVRDWIHVEDHVAGLMAAARLGRPGEVYNFGAKTERTNVDVVRAVCDDLDQAAPRGNGSRYFDLVQRAPDRPGHDRRYALDTSKAERELGWSPMTSFESGLPSTVGWYVMRGIR
jgi:dTDP-glucose 4,6-dehydratase